MTLGRCECAQKSRLEELWRQYATGPDENVAARERSALNINKTRGTRASSSHFYDCKERNGRFFFSEINGRASGFVSNVGLDRRDGLFSRKIGGAMNVARLIYFDIYLDEIHVEHSSFVY